MKLNVTLEHLELEKGTVQVELLIQWFKNLWEIAENTIIVSQFLEDLKNPVQMAPLIKPGSFLKEYNWVNLRHSFWRPWQASSRNYQAKFGTDSRDETRDEFFMGITITFCLASFKHHRFSLFIIMIKGLEKIIFKHKRIKISYSSLHNSVFNSMKHRVTQRERNYERWVCRFWVQFFFKFSGCFCKGNKRKRCVNKLKVLS